ncbi:hypothetical protein WOLCODRAFT_25869 [Wolfiporia cocos MD-104 SS10]|uniref:DUF6533 domain-containing protein n=1 Tax=Wolfiporia cocos (strain MD-104) TaxID=742152 RepID=A0A2H3JN99_WOLCO|nr:hypothetical protein WOLCODRAFT_25869 [Wolfiporia cocos MD-104 SS10]
MSSPTTFPAAEEIEYLTRIYTTNYCLAAVAALVVYEHIITFDREVFAIWRYRMTGATALLLFNGSVLLLTAVSNVLETFIWNSDQICKVQLVPTAVKYVLSVVIAAGFSALRVYAIAGRNWYWTLLALLTGLVPAATNIYQYISDSHPHVEYFFGIPQCMQTISLSDSVFDGLLITTRTCAIVSDLVVIAATWMYARPWGRYASNTQIKTPLMAVIVRDGETVEVLLILNITQMAIQGVSYFTSGAIYWDYITTFIPVISSILTSRFIFNLRQHTDEGNSTGSNAPSFVAGSMGSRGSIEYGNRLVGNMGAPLDHSIPDSLLFDDGDEPHEDIGCNEKLPVEQAHNVERRGEGRSDAENEVGTVTTP